MKKTAHKTLGPVEMPGEPLEIPQLELPLEPEAIELEGEMPGVPLKTAAPQDPVRVVAGGAAGYYVAKSSGVDPMIGALVGALLGGFAK